jgi:hypothetical protein
MSTLQYVRNHQSAWTSELMAQTSLDKEIIQPIAYDDRFSLLPCLYLHLSPRRKRFNPKICRNVTERKRLSVKGPRNPRGSYRLCEGYHPSSLHRLFNDRPRNYVPNYGCRFGIIMAQALARRSSATNGCIRFGCLNIATGVWTLQTCVANA